MAGAAAQYDLHTALYTYAPGVEMTRDVESALALQYQSNGYSPLTQSQVLAITGPLPAYPAGMKRFSDSNPDPRDGWALDQRGRC